MRVLVERQYDVMRSVCPHENAPRFRSPTASHHVTAFERHLAFCSREGRESAEEGKQKTELGRAHESLLAGPISSPHSSALGVTKVATHTLHLSVMDVPLLQGRFLRKPVRSLCS